MHMRKFSRFSFAHALIFRVPTVNGLRTSFIYYNLGISTTSCSFLIKLRGGDEKYEKAAPRTNEITHG